MFIGILKSMMVRNDLAQFQLARYLGVPYSTLSCWLNGRREIDAATVRLLSVLYILEREAPLIHQALLDQARGGPSLTFQKHTPRKYPDWSKENYRKLRGLR